MHTFFKFISLAVFVITVFMAGAITAGMRHWFQPIVSVTIKNDSGQNITSLKLTHETSDMRSVTLLKPLAIGQSTTANFFVAGEGGYDIVATLADGRELGGGSGYVESGYKITEVVSSSSIKNTTLFLAP